MPLAQGAQAGLDARSAIGLAALLVDAQDLLFKLLVFLPSPSRMYLALAPIVVTAGRDGKGPTEQRDGMVDFQGVDPLVALLGGSERMPKVFFKISRC